MIRGRESREHPMECALRGLDAVAPHRTRTIDQYLQAQRHVGGCTRHVRTKTCQHHIGGLVHRDHCHRPRRQAGHRQDEITIERSRAVERHRQAVLRPRHGNRV